MSHSDFLELVEQIDASQTEGVFIEVNGEVTHQFI